MTHTYIKTVEQPTPHYLTRSVRRRAAWFKSASVYRRFGAVRSAIVPEAIQIAVHQSVEKMPEHSVTNRRVEHFSRAHSQKHWGFERFLSACFLKTPRQLLRFYYARQRVVAN